MEQKILSGKTIVLAVTGSIAAYKIANLARMLLKLGAQVQVMMTQNATNFIHPITFESLTGRKCLIDTFDRNFQYSVEHVALAKEADLVLIAPASANVIGKIVHGIADDMLTTTVMACPCPKIISPAMNTHMYLNPVVQDNLRKLQEFGMEVIPPEEGKLANGDMGIGRMPSEQVLLNYVLRSVAFQKDMIGKKVLVTAGATREFIDPVRFLSNPSSGRMGYAVAENCMLRGAEVILVTGKAEIEPPPFVTVVPVVSAEDMFREVTARSEAQDFIIKAAAVSDYTPMEISTEKVKKGEGSLMLELCRTKDILAYLGEHKREGQFLCGFSMETQNTIQNARKKLEAKHLDMIAANNLKEEGAGFGVDTNVVTLLTRDKEIPLPKMTKEEVAAAIIDQILSAI